MRFGSERSWQAPVALVTVEYMYWYCYSFLTRFFAFLSSILSTFSMLMLYFLARAVQPWPVFCRPTQCVRAAIAMATWLSVFVSVTLMYCAQTTESITIRPLPDCSPPILVLFILNMNPIARGDPPFEGVKWEMQRVGESRKILPRGDVVNQSRCSNVMLSSIHSAWRYYGPDSHLQCPIITAICFRNMDTVESWYIETGGLSYDEPKANTRHPLAWSCHGSQRWWAEALSGNQPFWQIKFSSFFTNEEVATLS